MRRAALSILTLGVLSLSATAFASATATTGQTTAKTHTTSSTAAATASHAINGVVKSVDDTSLVISRGKHDADMTFVLNTSTQRDGDVAVGAPVSVRYRKDGAAMVATAVKAQPKPHASHPSK